MSKSTSILPRALADGMQYAFLGVLALAVLLAPVTASPFALHAPTTAALAAPAGFLTEYATRLTGAAKAAPATAQALRDASAAPQRGDEYPWHPAVLAAAPVTGTIYVSQSAGFTQLAEGNGSDNYAIVLSRAPNSLVSIQVSDVSGQIQVSTDTTTFSTSIDLIFTSSNWFVAQTVNLRAVNDAVYEGKHYATVTHNVYTLDSQYQGIEAASVTAGIDDNDNGIEIQQSGRSTDLNESDGVGDTITVRLSTQPTGPVTVTAFANSQAYVRTSASAVLSPVSITSLAFSSANWSTPQTMYVSASDDSTNEGAHTASITFAADSADKFYDTDGSFGGVAITNFSTSTVVTNIVDNAYSTANSTTARSIAANVTDNDSKVVIEQSGGRTFVKEGAPSGDSYTLQLASQPTDNVSITLAISPYTAPTVQAQLLVSPMSLTFTPNNWNVPQVVTVRAVDDVTLEGSHSVTITHTIRSTSSTNSTVVADANFNLTGIGSVKVTILDNDTANNGGADFDGDGRADIAIYRPNTAQWIYRQSSNIVVESTTWGLAGGADIPVNGDFDGDGFSDPAVYRPSTAQWFVKGSVNNDFSVITWGLAGGADVPVPADYDGDGATDRAIFRPSTAQWIIRKSSTGTAQVETWGVQLTAGEVPVPGDYDGDTMADVAIYRRSTAQWIVKRSSDGATSVITWGEAGGADVPIVADLDGDKRADRVVYRPSTSQWFAYLSNTGTASVVTWGAAGTTDVPVAADWDRDGKSDPAVFRISSGQWFVKLSGYADGDYRQALVITWAAAGSIDYPLPAPDSDGNVVAN